MFLDLFKKTMTNKALVNCLAALDWTNSTCTFYRRTETQWSFSDLTIHFRALFRECLTGAHDCTSNLQGLLPEALENRAVVVGRNIPKN